jgi:Flp pilus assembly protein TadG
MAARPSDKTTRINLFARFGADRKGVSALEFALVAPILILTYFGVGELCEAMMAERRSAHAASAVGDLTAQTTSVAASDVSDIFAAATDILTPFPTAPLKLRLTSVTANATAIPKVDWSCAQGGLTANTAGATYSGLPTGLVVLAGDSVIVAESQYKWTPPATYILPNGLTFNQVFYLKPRKSATVTGPASC